MLTIEAGRFREGLAIIDETFILTCIVLQARWLIEVFSRKLCYEYTYQMFALSRTSIEWSFIERLICTVDDCRA